MNADEHQRIAVIIEFAEAIMALRDPFEDGHEKRVAVLTEKLGRQLGFSDHYVDLLRCCGHLHDIGKIMIAEDVLNKVKLTTSEINMMRSHAEMGAKLIGTFHFDHAVEDTLRYHHENWDGSGYPSGLSREAIPLGARILRVADCYDAMTSERPYRKAFSKDDALEEMTKEVAISFDPEIFWKFKRMMASNG